MRCEALLFAQGIDELVQIEIDSGKAERVGRASITEISDICRRSTALSITWHDGGEIVTRRSLIEPGALPVTGSVRGLPADCHAYLAALPPIPIDNLQAARGSFRARYAFSIPTKEAVDAIASFGGRGIIDYGTGNGYWSFLLRAAGVEVIAFDVKRVDFGTNIWYARDGRFTAFPWTDIQIDTTQAFWSAPRNENLLLIAWPQPGPAAQTALDSFTGEYLCYIGERGRECGSVSFFASISEGWEPVLHVDLPRFICLSDDLTVYKRR